MIKAEGSVDQLTVDGIHINEAGHQMLAKEIEKHVLSLIGDD
jgi:lysophospholipase L1-like esterase